MKLDFAFLADAGFAHNDSGLFSVLNGGIDVIRCPQFPGGIHALVLIGRMSFKPDECNKSHLIDIELIAPDGSALPPGFRGVALTPGPHKEFGQDRDSWLTLVFTFQSLIFQSPGVYRFRVSHTDKSLGDLGVVPVDVIPTKDLK